MRKFINTVLAGALGLSMAAGVTAADVDDGVATVEITSDAANVLSVSIGTAEFTDVEYSFEDVTTNGNIVVLVQDDTGRGEGWTVTLSGTDFERDEDTSFSVNYLSLAAGTVVSTAGQPVTDGISTSPIVEVSDTEVMFASADALNGMGHYTITSLGTLTVPGRTLVGEYESTLTVTITGEDPGDEE